MASLDKRSDIYSLGIILYQMLVGRRPFEGLTPEVVMIKHLSEQPPQLRIYRPELPNELEKVLGRALAKDAEHRYPTAGELFAAFKRALTAAEEQARRLEEERVRRAAEEQAIITSHHPKTQIIPTLPRHSRFDLDDFFDTDNFEDCYIICIIEVLIISGALGFSLKSPWIFFGLIPCLIFLFGWGISTSSDPIVFILAVIFGVLGALVLLLLPSSFFPNGPFNILWVKIVLAVVGFVSGLIVQLLICSEYGWL